MIEELDLLKKDWKKSEKSFQQVTEVDIYKMIHKQSSSIVKWILIISIIELVLWTSLGLLMNTDEYLKKINSEYLIEYFKYINIFNYGVILVFIYCFFKNYKNISTTDSTKQLMKDILRTRKTVKYYVWYNLGMIAISFVCGIILAFASNPDINKISDNPKVMAISIGISIVFMLAFVGVFWLFYRLIYGTLLRRLFKNYNELKKIDL
jgi:uncharacterized protein with PQ loop repeat